MFNSNYGSISQRFRDDVKKYNDLEIRVRGHSKSSKVTPFDSLPMVSYLRPVVTVCVCKMHRFGDIRLLKLPDLETRVKGQSTSLAITPLERSYTTSY